MYVSLLLVVSLSASQLDTAAPAEDGSIQMTAGQMSRPYETPNLSATYTGIDPWSAPSGNDWVDSGECCDGGNGLFGRCCRGWGGRCCGPCSCHSTCDMYPHYWYYPEHHGYYYFRPYNYTHIFEHQAIVARWGGDPRNPYSHELFHRLYSSYGVEAPTLFEPSLHTFRPGLPNLEEMVKRPQPGNVQIIPEFNSEEQTAASQE